VAARGGGREGTLSALVEEISRELLGTPVTYSDDQLALILDPRHFVNVRRTPGGPAPEEAARAAGASRSLLHVDRDWWSGATDALTAAERRLADASARL
jgi:argininosuccinate lyase